MASLNEVGAELRELQPVAEDVGAALAVVHHWNKTGTGTGAGRMSGAGAEQWGRVLWSVSVGSRSTDPDRELSSVVGLDVELIGGCLLYTSDAADERSSVDLGGRRIIKKKTRIGSKGSYSTQ